MTKFGRISIFPSCPHIRGIYRKSLLISREEDDTGSLITRAGRGGGGGGVLLRILGGGFPPRSPNPDSISDQSTVIFLQPLKNFQTWSLKSIPCHLY